MIQAVRKNNFNSFLSLADSRIDLTTPFTNVKHLFKLTNDMDKSIDYVYPQEQIYGERYVHSSFIYSASPDMFNGQVNLKPAGYYKYEVYEVSWSSGCPVVVNSTYAPANETQSIELECAGVVQGLVAIGKLYLAEKPGEEQVQYKQRQEPSGTNYIYY